MLAHQLPLMSRNHTDLVWEDKRIEMNSDSVAVPTVHICVEELKMAGYIHCSFSMISS